MRRTGIHTREQQDVLGFRRLLQRGGDAVGGVTFGSETTAAVHLRPGDRDRSPRLLACDLLSGAPQAIDSALGDWVERHGAAGARAVGVLARGEYQVLSIEAPPVEAAELRQAVGWSIRDLIDFPLAEAVIDTFDMPEPARRGRRTMYVVVARRKTVAARVEQIERAGLTVAAIDIPELAQREVSDRLDVDGGHALLALDDRQGLLTVFREGEHYLARALDIGRTTLAERGDAASSDLVLEVQRSFDYYESALSQPPLGSLLLFPADETTEIARAAVAEQLPGIGCRAIDMSDIVDIAGEPPATGAAGLHALGAALRAADPQALGAAA